MPAPLKTVRDHDGDPDDPHVHVEVAGQARGNSDHYAARIRRSSDGSIVLIPVSRIVNLTAMMAC